MCKDVVECGFRAHQAIHPREFDDLALERFTLHAFDAEGDVDVVAVDILTARGNAPGFPAMNGDPVVDRLVGRACVAPHQALFYLAGGADGSDEQAVADAVQQVVDTLGAPTVLVNNAGIIRDNLLFKMSVADWDQVMAVHLRGSFLMTRATESFMREASFGRIVNLSSVSALGNRGQANYSAAKAGLQGFTKTLAIELGRFGVTANAIAPGFIETEMTAETAARIGIEFEELKKMAAAEIPVARTGTPEDIAHTASFLVSEGAGFVSGQVIYVAGGPKD